MPDSVNYIVANVRQPRVRNAALSPEMWPALLHGSNVSPAAQIQTETKQNVHLCHAAKHADRQATSCLFRVCLTMQFGQQAAAVVVTSQGLCQIPCDAKQRRVCHADHEMGGRGARCRREQRWRSNHPKKAIVAAHPHGCVS